MLQKAPPIVIISYGRKDMEKKAKEMGMTAAQYQEHLQNTGVEHILIDFV